MKNLIKETIDALIDEALFKSDVGSFDIRHFKQLSINGDSWHLMEYAATRLPFLGSGSARSVYALSTGKVLKIARNKKNGLKQNQYEVEFFKKLQGNINLVAKIYEYDPEYKWIIAEPVRAFQNEAQMKKETGGLNSDVLDWFYFRFSEEPEVYSGKTWPEVKQIVFDRLSRSDFASNKSRLEVLKKINSVGWELLEKFFILHHMGLVDIAREDHWGVASDRRLVVIDYGYPEGKTDAAYL